MKEFSSKRGQNFTVGQRCCSVEGARSWRAKGPLPDTEENTNPVVYFNVSASDEPLEHTTMELLSNIVPRTAEDIRALCMGEKVSDFVRQVSLMLKDFK
uniref:Uncharacterized protein n=1 Tax=Meleagris gallopavo TaxID=9103 RepID=A0A803XXD9_MELGA